jgi:hypothetical protein
MQHIPKVLFTLTNTAGTRPPHFPQNTSGNTEVFEGKNEYPASEFWHFDAVHLRLSILRYISSLIRFIFLTLSKRRRTGTGTTAKECGPGRRHVSLISLAIVHKSIIVYFT